MPKIKIGYKVVSAVAVGLTEQVEFHSCIAKSIHGLDVIYKIGETTYPQNPKFPLFVFTELLAARRFARSNHNHIFRVEYSEVRKPSVMRYEEIPDLDFFTDEGRDLRDLYSFWKDPAKWLNEHNHIYLNDLPSYTAFAHWVKCIEEVER